MNDCHFLSVKPLSQKTTRARHADCVLLNVMKHNLREILAEIGAGSDSKIIPSRTQKNMILHGPGTAADAAAMARDAMRKAGVTKVRKNATLGIEIVFSLPVGSKIDSLAYFQDAMRWSQKHFDVPMLSAVVHNDESYPHFHVVMLPMRDGTLIGSKLLGNRDKTIAMQASFHEEVGRRYGLLQQKPKRPSAAIRRQAIDAALEVLQANSGLSDAVLRVLVDEHRSNPEPLMRVLGLDMPEEKLKGSFVATMTRPCKPEKANRRLNNFLLGDLAHQERMTIGLEKQSPILVLGHCFSAQLISSGIEQHSDIIQDDCTRQPDAGQPVGYWDESTDDFIKPAGGASRKPLVTASVNAGLKLIDVLRTPPAIVMRC